MDPTRQKWWYEVAKGDVWTTAVRCQACRRKERERRNQARKIQQEGMAKKGACRSVWRCHLIKSIETQFKPDEWGGGCADWGYHELTDAGEGFFRHEILFSSGSTLLIEFKQVQVNRTLAREPCLALFLYRKIHFSRSFYHRIHYNPVS